MNNKHRIEDSFADALQIQKDAASLGFDWSSVMPVFEKVQEEVEEVKQELDEYLEQTAEATSSKAAPVQLKAKLESEIGDLLFTITNLCRHLELSPSQCLQKTNAKFSQRFDYVKQQAKAIGVEMSNTELAVLETFWQQAKRNERED